MHITTRNIGRTAIAVASALLLMLTSVGLSAPATAQPGQEDYPYGVETPYVDVSSMFGYNDVFYPTSRNRIAHKEWVSLHWWNDGTYDVGFEANITIARNNDAIDDVGDLPAKFLIRSKQTLEAGSTVSFTAFKVKNSKWLRPGKDAKLYKIKKNGKLKRIKKARVRWDDIVIPDIQALDRSLPSGPTWVNLQHLSVLPMVQ